MEILILAVAYPIAIAILFYFVFLRPVQEQQRRRKRDLDSLSVGDRVVTQAGFIAIVKDIVMTLEGSTEIVLEIAEGVEVRALASGIAERLVEDH